MYHMLRSRTHPRYTLPLQLNVAPHVYTILECSAAVHTVTAAATEFAYTQSRITVGERGWSRYVRRLNDENLVWTFEMFHVSFSSFANTMCICDNGLPDNQFHIGYRPRQSGSNIGENPFNCGILINASRYTEIYDLISEAVMNCIVAGIAALG